MLFPENADRVCMVTRNADEIKIMFFEPSGQSGGIGLHVNDVKGLVDKLIKICPEYLDINKNDE